jgi:hypothetical protein
VAADVVDQSAAFNLSFQANPLQYAFITSRAEADLWACRMGEGKSTGLAWAIFHFTQANPGAIFALIRDTFENLRDTTMKDFFEWFPPGVCGEYNENKKLWKWRLGEMRGEVMMMGMDDPSDATKLQSRKLGGFAMDEPAPAAESGGIAEEIFNTAMTRLRQPGMKWYAAKLAENAPDETHWTYQRFVDPGDAGTPPEYPIAECQKRGFTFFQGVRPENEKNLPPGYYARLKSALKNRPDLIRRFADGGFGFQQIGKSVTPQWSDAIHLAEGLEPLGSIPLWLFWDWGLNPTCTITQVTPLGFWNVLECHVGEDMGAFELVGEVVKPRVQERFKGLTWAHSGDPMGKQREQSSSEQSAVKVIRKELGGRWKPGPVHLRERIDPLNAVLARVRNGVGVVQVDKHHARAIWHALRGGWHYNVTRTGIVSQVPVKDIHSHPGDTMGYGAAELFPLGQLKNMKKAGTVTRPKHAQYRRGSLGFERPGLRLPKEARTIGDKPDAH